MTHRPFTCFIVQLPFIRFFITDFFWWRLVLRLVRLADRRETRLRRREPFLR
jgi:hypothetical protein